MQCTSLRMPYNVIRKTKTQPYCKTPKHHTKCKAQCRNMGRTNQSRIDYANIQQKRPKEGRHILRSAYESQKSRLWRWSMTCISDSNWHDKDIQWRKATRCMCNFYHSTYHPQVWNSLLTLLHLLWKLGWPWTRVAPWRVGWLPCQLASSWPSSSSNHLSWKCCPS